MLYKVITVDRDTVNRTQALEQLINKAVKEGYKVQGGIATNNYELYVLMVKEDNKNNENKEELINAQEKVILEEVNSIIEKRVDINSIYDGWTPLTLASSSGYYNMVEYLVKKGADVNAKSSYGWTALMWASMIGNFKIVKYLVENGADINAKNDYGWTASMWASMIGDFEIVNYLVKKGGVIDFEKYNKKDNGAELLLYSIINGAIINSGNLETVATLMRNNAKEDIKKFFKDKDNDMNKQI